MTTLLLTPHSCTAGFGFYEYDSHTPPSLLTGPRPLPFFPIPEDERGDVLAALKRSRMYRRR
jgi:hypothetical protein